MLPLIVSFYTRDWEYPQHAKRLKAECEQLGLEYCIEERPSRKGYLENTCIKPTFISEMLYEHRRPILWIDVDASIYKRPDFFWDLTADFAAKRMAATRKRTWHVGTMWFNFTRDTIEFVDRWVKVTGEISDESALEATWQDFGWLNAVDIPPTYFQIEKELTVPPSSVVIMHRLSNSPSKRQQQSRFDGDRAQKPI